MLPDSDNGDEKGASGSPRDPPEEHGPTGAATPGQFARRSVPSDRVFDNRAQDEIFITVDKLRLFLDFWDDQRSARTREQRHRSYAGSALLICLTCVIALVTASEFHSFLFGDEAAWKAFFVALAGGSLVAGVYFLVSGVVGASVGAAQRWKERRDRLDPLLPADRPATPEELLESIKRQKDPPF